MAAQSCDNGARDTVRARISIIGPRTRGLELPLLLQQGQAPSYIYFLSEAGAEGRFGFGSVFAHYLREGILDALVRGPVASIYTDI